MRTGIRNFTRDVTGLSDDLCPDFLSTSFRFDRELLPIPWSLESSRLKNCSISSEERGGGSSGTRRFAEKNVFLFHSWKMYFKKRESREQGGGIIREIFVWEESKKK